MSTATGRNDRRRRILNDGVRAAADDSVPADSTGEGDVRRYATNDDSASFAVARRVLPHRRRMILGVVALGVAGITALIAAHLQQGPIRGFLQIETLPAIDLTSGASLARWAVSTTLLLIGGLALVVYGLRRRRTDDVRGAYRWWLSASAIAVLGSTGVATGVHRSLAEAADAAAGWSPAGDPALWWMITAALAAGAVVIRVVLDLKHCVPALFAAVTGVVCVAAMLVAEFGGLPATAAQHAGPVSHGASLAAMLMAVATLLCYCRRIVLEADGVINAPAEKPVVKEEKKAAAKKTATAKAAATKATTRGLGTPEPAASKPAAPTAASVSPPSRKKAKAAVQEPPKLATTQWTDGSDGDADYDDEGGRRKLSKAERKRLRKLKARQNRAA